MLVLVTRKNDTTVVSINEESFIIPFTEESFAKLENLETKFKASRTMQEAKSTIEEIREFVKTTSPDYEENFVCKGGEGHLVFNVAKGTYHLKTEKGVISQIPVPKVIVERMVTSIDKGISILPLVKATIRFFRNPNLNPQKLKNFGKYVNYEYLDLAKYDELISKGFTKEAAAGKSTFFQTPITTEGLLCTYKVSEEVTTKFALDENGNSKVVNRYAKMIDENTGEITTQLPDFVEDRLFIPAVQKYTGDTFVSESLDKSYSRSGHFYIVGHVHYLDSWNKVNCDDSHACVPGLHCGNLDYIRGYQHAGTATHNVFVDPMNIGAFTNDGSGAIRVKELFIHSSKMGENRGIYFSSDYAAYSDAKWEELKVEAIENSNKLLSEFKEDIEKHSSIYEVI